MKHLDLNARSKSDLTWILMSFKTNDEMEEKGSGIQQNTNFYIFAL